MTSSTSVVFALVAVLCLCSWTLASPSYRRAPSELELDEGADDMCTKHVNAKYNELICEKCATIGRSPVVYDMCCRNEQNGFNWCKDVIVGEPNDRK